MGPVRLRKLLAAFGSPGRILIAREEELRNVDGVGQEVARSIASWESHVDVAGEIQRVEMAGATVLIQSDPGYPECLREIHDPPIVLYVLGEMSEGNRPSIGVVGTRKPTHYAAECAKKLSFQLAYSGITVVSGLARGVDTLAHQGALAAKGRTVAVIGSGLNRLYPPENRELAARIAAEGGAVISEFPMETSADKQTFPMRNRIISGLSFGLLVVEAGGRSGALISASQAVEQGRSIYAIPGRIDNPGAIGSNRLIQQGAKLVCSAEDILDDLQILFRDRPKLTPPPPPSSLNETESKVFSRMGSEEVTVDELVAKTGLLSHHLSSSLLALEMRGLVKQLPGSRFVKLS